MSGIIDGDCPVTERFCNERHNDTLERIRAINRRLAAAAGMLSVLVVIFMGVVSYAVSQSGSAMWEINETQKQLREEVVRSTGVDQNRDRQINTVDTSLDEIEKSQSAMQATLSRVEANQERLLKSLNGHTPP